MSWIEDIIKSLPSEQEELARIYLPAIRRMAREEVLNWVNYLAYHRNIQAHAMIVQRMTTEEIAADGDRGNEIIKDLNTGNAENVDLVWHILRMLVTIGMNKVIEA